MSRLTTDSARFGRHYFAYATVEDAPKPVFLVCFASLLYMVLPALVAPEQILVADFFTCLGISLCAVGYLITTAYASPSLMVLPRRRRRTALSLGVVAVFEMLVLSWCSGIWLLMGLATKNHPSWAQVLVGMFVVPVGVGLATYWVVTRMGGRLGPHLARGGEWWLPWIFVDIQVLMPSLHDALIYVFDGTKPKTVEMFLPSLYIVARIVYYCWSKKRPSIAKALPSGVLGMLPSSGCYFTNATQLRSYLRWYLRRSGWLLPAVLMSIFIPGPSMWVERRFRQRALRCQWVESSSTAIIFSMFPSLVCGLDSFFSTFFVGLVVLSFFVRSEVFSKSLLPTERTTEEMIPKIIGGCVACAVAFIALNVLILVLLTRHWISSPKGISIIGVSFAALLYVTVANYVRWFKRVETEMQQVVLNHDVRERVIRKKE